MRSLRVMLGVLGLSVACGPDPDAAAPRADEARVQGMVVARVNGDAISLEEVRKVCAASGLAPEDALARLVEERLLAQHAEARGYGDLAETRAAVTRARVRALLEEQVERGDRGDAERAHRLEQLLQKLRAQTEVVYDERAVREALADDAMLGTGT